MKNYLGTLLLVSASAGAQPLTDFLSSAANANVDAQLSAHARARAELEFAQAWGGLLPSLTANGGWTHNQYEAVVTISTGPTTSVTAIIVPKDQLDATLRAELTLIDASKWLRTAAAASSADAAGLRERATQEQVQRQVVSNFHSYLAARAVLESARRSLSLARVELNVAKARAEAGLANQLEQARAQAEVDRNEQLVADAEALAETGARALTTVSGLAPNQPLSLGEPDLTPAPPLPSLEGQLEALPTVRAAEADVVSAQRTTTAGALTLLPSVSAQFTQRFTNAPSFQNQTALYNAGINFNWRLDLPAVQGFRVQQLAHETAVVTASRTLRQAGDQLHSDWHQLNAALKKVQAAKSQVAAALEAVSLTRERTGAGVATQLELIQAQRDLFGAEVSDIQARASLANARALLALSAGQPVVVR